ncbi:putative signal transducing protein [Maribacter sp. IgM3_T14_3]|uniref:putative signal transducing protein n=1 Tax=Maribacter sp. IgM3_T14_3 TaxID=3415140 RepID=UPI003C6F2074
MDSNYIKVFGGNSIAAKRVELALKENNIEPILKDETESARLAGFGTPLPVLVEIFVNKDEEVRALSIITEIN